ncbi:hypothetical protein OE88DRAFT_602979 [Heliocybe sulcata]|uniref:Uncharacterized protein n=1 Tax=Heliocybe sulcata TaxID=5364 RepID=A0A5C3MTF6_9AGAM|nr:hypothetical protein OE88DRAFT_602979 [Heliocybe sulcata]
MTFRRKWVWRVVGQINIVLFLMLFTHSGQFERTAYPRMRCNLSAVDALNVHGRMLIGDCLPWRLRRLATWSLRASTKMTLPWYVNGTVYDLAMPTSAISRDQLGDLGAIDPRNPPPVSSPRTRSLPRSRPSLSYASKTLSPRLILRSLRRRLRHHLPPSGLATIPQHLQPGEQQGHCSTM